jgi:hypothetical protein
MQIHSLPTGATGNLYIVSEVTDPSGSAALTASANTLSVAAPFIDLQPLLIRAPAAIKAGKKGPVSVTLINKGNVAANGILSIDLQASTDGAINSNSIDLGTVVRSILIEPGKKAVLSLPGISFPNTRGSYYIVASIDPSNTFNESTLSDKSLSSATTVRLT